MDADLTWFELLRNAIDALKANAPAASVVIAVLAFLVSLATYRRAWRWRSEATCSCFPSSNAPALTRFSSDGWPTAGMDGHSTSKPLA